MEGIPWIDERIYFHTLVFPQESCDPVAKRKCSLNETFAKFSKYDAIYRYSEIEMIHNTHVLNAGTHKHTHIQ